MIPLNNVCAAAVTIGDYWGEETVCDLDVELIQVTLEPHLVTPCVSGPFCPPKLFCQLCIHLSARVCFALEALFRVDRVPGYFLFTPKDFLQWGRLVREGILYNPFLSL